MLLGGRAVNVWADACQHLDAELRKLAPFTSRDCDVLGNRDLLGQLARKTGWKAEYRPLRAPTSVIGYLTHQREDGVQLVAEVLRTVYGLTREECEKSAVPLEYDNHRYRLMSPISLHKAKVANAANLRQGGRQDLKHVRMLIRCVRHFLAETQ